MRIHTANSNSRDRGPFPQQRLVAGLVFCLALPVANAQVATDGTLGARVNIAGPNFVVSPSVGRVSGQNLFHSFATLTVRSGQTLTFLSDGSIQNVISRVTGGQPSQIDGQIRSATANVNIFLLNPAGVFFGPTSSLNVAASFYASTADHMGFADGSRFSSRYFGPEADVLPSTAPETFGFLDRAANIQLTGAQLRVGDGRAIGLIGGNLSMTSQAGRVSVVSAPGGSVAAVASGGASEVLLNGRFRSGSPSGRLELLAGTVVSVNEGALNRGSGSLVIRGGNVFIDHSRVLAQTRNGDGGEIDIEAAALLYMDAGEVNAVTTGQGNAAQISLRATDIEMRDDSKVDSSCDPGCTTGRGGDIRVAASRSLIMRSSVDSSPVFIASDTFGGGATGHVSITSPLVSMSGFSTLQAITLGAGNSSGISLNVGTLRLTSGAQVNTSSQSSGKGGVLTINASDHVEIVGGRIEGLNLSKPSGLFTNAEAGGDAGSIQIKTGRLSLLGGGQISSSAARNSSGNGGNVSVVATGDVIIAGQMTSQALTRSGIAANTFSIGRGGQVSVTADRLIVEDNGFIQSQSDGQGTAGTISIRGGELVLRNRGQISSDARARGAGGSIDISTSRSVSIAGASSGLFAKSEGPAAGGSIVVRSPEIRLSDAGGIYSSAIGSSAGSGNGGAIDVIAGKTLTLDTGAVILAEAFNTGNAGSIGVQAGESVIVDQSRISSQTIRSGAAGQIVVRGGELVVRNAGQVTSDTRGAGAGGSIDVSTLRAVTLSGANSGLFSRTDGVGAGGAISVKSADISLLGGAGISVSSNPFVAADGSVTATGRGNSGSINVAASGKVSLAGVSYIEAASGTTGNAGSIVIYAGGDLAVDQSRISTSARSADGGNISVSTDGKLIMSGGSITTEVGTGLGDGGNVSVSGAVMVLRQSNISANAFGGDGGNIGIASQNVLSDTSSSVTASSELGIDGTVRFESPAADLSGALFSVNSSFLDANAVLAARCVGPDEGARTRLAMRLFDADHRIESGFLFPQASAPVARSVAQAVVVSLLRP